MPTVAKLAVQAATYAIDKAYDYLLPDELPGRVGCRVLVPFGRGNRLRSASNFLKSETRSSISARRFQEIKGLGSRPFWLPVFSALCFKSENKSKAWW